MSVIYLYPEQETDVHVELELTESELNTTYPKYDSGWDVTAYPDGAAFYTDARSACLQSLLRIRQRGEFLA